MPNTNWRQIVTLSCLFAVAACSNTSVDNSRNKASNAVRDALPELTNNWDAKAASEELLEGWISSFNDTALTQLIAEAVANNRNLAASAASVTTARLLAEQAGAGLLPNVGFSSGTSRSGVADNSREDTTGLNANVQISWEADVWGRVSAGSDAAQLSAEAAQSDYRFAQLSLAAGTAKAYFASIEATLQKETASEDVKALEETLRLVNLRHADGMASAAEQSLARSDLAAARERLIAVDGSTRDAIRALEVLLGRYPGAELTTRKTLPELPATPSTGLPSSLLQRRPDMIAAENRVAAAFSKVDQAVAARLPSINLSQSVGGASSSLSDLLKPSNIAWQLGASLVAPIFDGGVRKANVKIAGAEQQQAVAAYAQAALTAFNEVETALDQGHLLKLREKELKEVVAEAKNALRINNLRYEEGELSLLDLLSTQRRVNSAKANLVSVQRLQLTQRVDLHLALGGNW
jgi:NodT family efflux transporter outer membrane factor (OMF) lipoprotein